MSALPVKKVADIGESPPQRWLVESLWTQQAVGLLAGHPKSKKSWLALDIAVSVASGSPALDRFAVGDPGPVLLFPAEDALTDVRDRIAGICRHRGVDFSTLPLWLISSYVLRLDSREDREGLETTVDELRPRLLVLDPLIRIHSADENSATEITRVLSYLRDLQRKYAVAVLVVHHARKSTSSDPGLGLRGSTEIRAWSDTNLYMQRKRGLELSVEHRAAPCPEPFRLALLSEDENAVHLAIEEKEPPKVVDLGEAILALLGKHDVPLSREFIRSEVGVRNQRLGEALQALLEGAMIEKGAQGYTIRNGTRASA
jgi:hypothetical protein